MVPFILLQSMELIYPKTIKFLFITAFCVSQWDCLHHISFLQHNSHQSVFRPFAGIHSLTHQEIESQVPYPITSWSQWLNNYLVSFYLFIPTHTEGSSMPPSPVTTPPPQLALPSARIKCACAADLFNLSQSHSSLLAFASRILNTSWKYFTKSESLSNDFPSLRLAK